MQTYHHPMRVCDSADFDGTNDRLTRGAGLTGAADSKSGVLSFWARLDGNDGATRQIIAAATTVGGSTLRFRARFLIATNIFTISGFNAAGTEILTIPSSTAYTAAATWRHFLASWNLATGAGHLYVGDVSDLGSATLTDDTIDYTLADWGVGDHPGSGNQFSGCLSELYFAPGQYVDLSNVYWRRKFISATGKPVHLGSDGSLATGTAPLVYHHLDDGEAVANFATNRGAGGDFAITGTLETGSSSPSD
jgi:hypothetical protein